MVTASDPALDAIREVRCQISAQHGHSVEEFVQYYIDLQNEMTIPHPTDSGLRIFRLPEAWGSEMPVAPERTAEIDDGANWVR